MSSRILPINLVSPVKWTAKYPNSTELKVKYRKTFSRMQTTLQHDDSTPWVGIALSKFTNRFGIRNKTTFFKYWTLGLTFITYMSYHLTRKVVSVVTPVLEDGSQNTSTSKGEDPWPPFDKIANQDSMIAGLDSAFLFAYAFGMFVSGHIAERVDLRYFLTAGCILSGGFTAIFGLGKIFDIHNYMYYMTVQALNGLVQSTGWPAVVPLMGNWFGVGKRGLILGLWNSHTSWGNILGSVIAGIWVDENWAYSFIVPGIIMAGVGVIVFLCLVPYPELVFCPNPNHAVRKRTSSSRTRSTLESGPHQGTTVQSSTSYADFSNPSPYSVQFREGDNEDSSTENELSTSQKNKPAVGIIQAIKVPGVIEYSLCLFFNKMVSYSFLYWLPTYIKEKQHSTSQEAANLSTVFDFGGLTGGILLGLLSDLLEERSLVTAVSIIVAAPVMGLYQLYGDDNSVGIPILFVTGMAVNGPYALITTAISSDLGTHNCLRENKKALATVTAIIDGTGSLGAAIGALVCFELNNIDYETVFYFLIASNLVSLIFLTRLLLKSVSHYRDRWTERRIQRLDHSGSSSGLLAHEE